MKGKTMNPQGRNRRPLLFAALLATVFLLAGCNLFYTQTPEPIPVDPGAVQTQAAQTVIAELTQTALVPVDNNAIFTQVAQTVIADQTQNAPTPTFTPTPTDLPTATPQPTFTPVTPTATPRLIPCDAAAFITDVSIPDGTTFPPNARFTKTWRLQNVGTCTWNNTYDLVFISGERMGAANVLPLSGNVVPGQTIDLSVELIAPGNPGTYRGNWMLRNPQGVNFGIGGDNDDPFWVQIRVAEPQTDYAYDFVFNVCEADWRSAATGTLPCPGRSGDSQGYVLVLDRPALETGKIENEPGLLVVPNNRSDGFIEGVFRNILIRDGYRFRSGVSCADNSKGCDVIFSLSYRLNGGQRVELGSWREVYDGQYNVANVDLSFLADERIDLILTVQANDSNRNNNAIWWVPHIDDN
jgi:hypothetical protein